MNAIDYLRTSKHSDERDDRRAIVQMDLEQFIMSMPETIGWAARDRVRAIAREVLTFIMAHQYGEDD